MELDTILPVGQIRTARRDGRAEQTHARDAFTTLALIDRNICLVRDPGPARRFQTHQVSELLRSHGFGSAPSLERKLPSSGEVSILPISALSALTISAGIPAGPTMPHQDHRSMPGIPASSRVGTSGSSAVRLALVTASALTSPLWASCSTCGRLET